MPPRLHASSTPHSPERQHAHAHALDALAKQQAERDARKHFDAGARTRQLAAESELTVPIASILQKVDFPSGSDHLGVSASSDSRTDSDLVVSHAEQTTQGRSPVELSRRAEADHAASLAAALATSRTALASAMGRPQLPGSDPIDPSKTDSGTKSRENGDESTSIVAAKYGSFLHENAGIAAPAQESIAIATKLAEGGRDISSSVLSRAQPATDEDAEDGLDGRIRNARGATDLRAVLQTPTVAQGNGVSTFEHADERDTDLSALVSAFYAAGGLPNQGNRGSPLLGAQTTIARNDERQRDDGRSPGIATGGTADSALTDAAGELEQLRVALSRTIDELEKARGVVQAPLPALPPNRGAFRIS